MSSASARAAAASAPFVTVSNVRHRYGGGAREALAGISFSVDQGACFGLLGPNGAGKSTMFALLTGIMKLQAGEISVGGVSARADLKALRAQAAIAPQDLAFYPALTGRQNLDFFAGAYRLDHDIWRARVAKAVAPAQPCHRPLKPAARALSR
jgi:ABC-2 type transport system ATP-binding protein